MLGPACNLAAAHKISVPPGARFSFVGIYTILAQVDLALCNRPDRADRFSIDAHFLSNKTLVIEGVLSGYRKSAQPGHTRIAYLSSGVTERLSKWTRTPPNPKVWAKRPTSPSLKLLSVTRPTSLSFTKKIRLPLSATTRSLLVWFKPVITAGDSNQWPPMIAWSSTSSR